MLETTFLGHQGWMFATGGARILVDPLLVEAFGHNGGVGVVYPPRRLDIASFPSITAVVLTHEHEDHFNIPSLNRVSRDVPIYAPERSSMALRQFLGEAGFTVRQLSAGRSVEFADLRLTCFATDHIRGEEQDEWDTMPFLVQDTKDGASFFSPVDVAVSATIEAMLRQAGVTPSLFGYANNQMNMSFQERPPRGTPALLPIATRFMLDHMRRPSPRLASLMCGGGFSFTGSRSWMNNLFFPIASNKLFEGLQAVSPEERFIVPIPGMQILADKDRIHSITREAPYLSALPENQWPDRSYQPQLIPPGTVAPACGRDELRAGELEELEAHLSAFAEFLYGTTLFRGLYSLTPGAMPPDMRASFAISAVSGDVDHVFEYDPTGCRFERLKSPASLGKYAAGLECFASDLLEFLQGKLAPSALMFGRICRWRGDSENLVPAVDRAIWLYGHPLRRPAQHLALYRSIYAREPAETAKLRRA